MFASRCGIGNLLQLRRRQTPDHGISNLWRQPIGYLKAILFASQKARLVVAAGELKIARDQVTPGVAVGKQNRGSLLIRKLLPPYEMKA